MISVGDIVVPHGRHYALRIDKVIPESVDSEGYMYTSSTRCELQDNGSPPVCPRDNNCIHHFKVITPLLWRSHDPMECGYPDETGLLPWYWKVWTPENEQMRLF